MDARFKWERICNPTGLVFGLLTRKSRECQRMPQLMASSYFSDNFTRSNAGCLRFLTLIQCFCRPPRPFLMLGHQTLNAELAGLALAPWPGALV
jgi:hypothetical protein